MRVESCPSLVRYTVVLLLALCTALPVTAELLDAGQPTSRISVTNPPSAPVPVTPWDTGSPQRLYRIEGKLYQKDAGFYYPAVDARITVRLAEGVQSWQELLDRAATAAPQSFGALNQLQAQRLNKLGIIDLVVPDGQATEWCDLLFRTGLVRYAEVPTVGVYLATANDPLYGQQWALNNTGQTGGTPGADIDAEAAWDLTAGDPSIIVGVLDSGVSVDHVDLAANIWHNDGEIPGNGNDDDANGFVDDYEGWDFGNNNNDPRSSNFHGTHVTGIINAVSDNGVGVAGLAGGLGAPGVRAMALGVGESGPIGSILDDAIIYAADNGAQVITMSLSVAESSAINDALVYAYNTRDVFIDCAAGNNGSSVGYPARRAEVMAVASTTDNDTHSSFSNPGPEVEIAAPGSSIQSTQLSNSYGSSSGTSFAAPYVAALASLVRSMNPGLPAAEVRQLLIDSAEDVEDPGFDNLTGWGRINAFQAVSMTATSDGVIRLDADRYSCNGTIEITVTDTDLAGSGTLQVTVRSQLETSGEVVTLVETGSGSGVFRGQLVTDDGAALPDTLLQAAHDDLLTAEYLDADNGEGSTNLLKNAVAVTDCQGPLIFDVTVADIDENSAEIRWTTDEPSGSLVRYGEFVPLTDQAGAAALTTEHVLQISGLPSCTSFRFEVESADDLGNANVDANGGLLFSFETYQDVPGSGIVPCHSGQVTLNKNLYGCSETAQIAVTDIDLDTDSGVAESIQVLLTSTSEPQGEWITLTEVGVENSRFEGTVTLAPATAPGDALLSSNAGDLISVTYYDGDDGDGARRTATYTSLADCDPPAIANLRVTVISATRAEIEWTTDEPSTSRVEYGPGASLGSVIEEVTLKTSHRVVVSAFEACDRVHFRVKSADARGDLRVADAAGQPFAFNMNQIGGLVFHDNFETDTGWIYAGDWSRGGPQGLGSNSGDPAVAYSGSAIIGNDLTGDGAFPGDYEPFGKKWVQSPLFNSSGIGSLELILRRKLGVVGDDLASVGVFAPGPFIVWSNASPVDDGDWVEARHDISALAADQAAVSIGFGIQSLDPGQSYGWNIDEVVVKDATQPDYLACGGCAEAPAFGGLVAAFDAEPCGAGGVTLSWNAAPAWGGSDTGAYDVYRGSTSDFEPGPGNRIATGLTATTWVDASAPGDTPVWYVVRARNDESCSGGEGIADTNLVRVEATETVSRPPADSIQTSVRGDRVGAVHVRLNWAPTAGADQYLIRRSMTAAFGASVDLGMTPETFFEDVNAVPDGNSYFYRVIPVNACGVETP